MAPVLVTALVLALLLAVSAGDRHLSASTFVVFGSANATAIHVPSGASVVPGPGYDGQIYWLQAHDPLLRHATTLRELARGWPGYHLQRVAYPALAWLFAGGDARLLPWTLLLINVVAVLGLTLGFSLYARNRGWNPMWALAVGLAPGLLMPALRDCSDVLALCTALAGLMLWERRRPCWAALAVSVAVLSREPMMLLVPALWLDAAGRCLRARRAGDSPLAELARSWPTLLVPVAAFGGWELYIHTLHSPAAAVGDGAGSALPFTDFVAIVDVAARYLGPLGLVWVLAYLAVTGAGMATSLLVAARGRSAVAYAAPLLALTLPIIDFGDQWGLTRYTAPMLLMLLLSGLQHRIRAAVWVAAAAAALSVALPLLVT